MNQNDDTKFYFFWKIGMWAFFIILGDITVIQHYMGSLDTHDMICFLIMTVSTLILMLIVISDEEKDYKKRLKKYRKKHNLNK